MLIQDFLREQAERDPGRLFLLHGDEGTTYGEVEEASNRLANFLLSRGIRPGDRVAILLPNGADYLSAYFGIMKARAVAVPLHAESRERNLEGLLGNCGGVGLIAGSATGSLIARTAARLPALRFVVLPDDEPAEDENPTSLEIVRRSEVDSFGEGSPGNPGSESDRAVIMYTSGSTGRPRGVILSHGNLVSNTRSILAYLHLTREDRVLVVLPFPYVYGQSLLLTHCAVGGALVVHDSLVFPETVLRTMLAGRVTGLSGVPSTFAILLNRSTLGRTRIPTLRYVTQAGGGLPVPHIRRLIAALPGIRIYIMYGATEAAGRLSYLDPGMLASKIGSVGQAVDDVELTIRRPDGSEAAVDEEGEITARGPNITEGYWDDEEATREVIDEQGFHTGDLARRDADGDLWIVGRKREMIKSGGQRICAREIEEVLLEHPDVDEAAVVGVADDYLGQAVVAHATLRPGATVLGTALRCFCAERLPACQVPAAVFVRAAMPRSVNGKLDRQSLGRESRHPLQVS